MFDDIFILALDAASQDSEHAIGASLHSHYILFVCVHLTTRVISSIQSARSLLTELMSCVCEKHEELISPETPTTSSNSRHITAGSADISALHDGRVDGSARQHCNRSATIAHRIR